MGSDKLQEILSVYFLLNSDQPDEIWDKILPKLDLENTENNKFLVNLISKNWLHINQKLDIPRETLGKISFKYLTQSHKKLTQLLAGDENGHKPWTKYDERCEDNLLDATIESMVIFTEQILKKSVSTDAERDDRQELLDELGRYLYQAIQALNNANDEYKTNNTKTLETILISLGSVECEDDIFRKLIKQANDALDKITGKFNHLHECDEYTECEPNENFVIPFKTPFARGSFNELTMASLGGKEGRISGVAYDRDTDDLSLTLTCPNSESDEYNKNMSMFIAYLVEIYPEMKDTLYKLQDIHVRNLFVDKGKESLSINMPPQVDINNDLINSLIEIYDKPELNALINLAKFKTKVDLLTVDADGDINMIIKFSKSQEMTVEEFHTLRSYLVEMNYSKALDNLDEFTNYDSSLKIKDIKKISIYGSRLYLDN